MVLLLLTIATWALPATGSAAVAFRSRTCTGLALTPWPWTFSMTKPAGTAAGDVLIATIRASGASVPYGSVSGWTELLTSGEVTTYYRVATASEAASYTFASGFTGSGSIVGSMAAFSGADPAAPFSGTAAQDDTGTAAVQTLPGGTVGRDGSLRYGMVSSAAARTTTFTGMTGMCDQTQGSIAVASAYEAVDSGPTATRTVTRNGTGASVLQSLVIQPPSACGAGGLSIVPPTAISFPATALTGYDQSIGGATTLRVSDMRGLGTGWSVSLTSTRFMSGGNGLPVGAARVTSVTPSPVAGRCSAPLNAIAVPLTVPAAAAPPPAAKIYNAQAGSGEGPTDLAVTLQLLVPAYARIGNYSSTWTFSVTSGP